MKNFEKWEKEILELVKDGDSFGCTNEGVLPCAMIDCHACIFRANEKDKRGCDTKKVEWLYEEYVELPKLNKAERAFCEAIKTGWIARNENNTMVLFMNDKKPVKNYYYNEWQNGGFLVYLNWIKDYNPKILFDFIKWDDEIPWNIEELLKLEIKNMK